MFNIKKKLKVIGKLIVILLTISIGFVPMYIWNINLQKQIEYKDKQINFSIDTGVAEQNQNNDYERFKEQLESNKSFVESIKNDVRLETTTVTVSKPIHAIKNSTDSTGIVGWWEGRKENNITIKIDYVCNYKIKYSDLQTKTGENGELLVHYNPETDFDVTVSVLSAIVLPSDTTKQGFMPEDFSPEEVINLLIGNEATLKSEMINNKDFISKSTYIFEEFFKDFAKKSGVDVKFVDYDLKS